MKRSGLSVIPKITLPAVASEQHPRPRLNELVVPHGHQFSLPFVDKPADRQTVIVPMEHIHGEQLCRLITDLKPQVVIDLRYVIRFDLPGTSRASIFRHIRAASSSYITIPVPWHQCQARDFMADKALLPARFTQEILNREGSAVLLLVARRTEARYLATYIHRILADQAGSSWHVVETV